MSILITLIVYLVILGLLWWLISMLPLPAPFPTIIQVVFVIIAILVLLSVTGLFPLGHFPITR